MSDHSAAGKRKYDGAQSGPPAAKKFKADPVEPGVRGFIVSVTALHKMRDSERELFQVLRETCGELYPSAGAEAADAEVPESAGSGLMSELAALKAENAKEKKSPSTKPLLRLDFPVRGLYFIALNNQTQDVVKIADHIFSRIRDTKLTNTRFTTRMVPVQTVCHSSIETMTLTLQPILDTFFQSHKPKSFAVQCAIRAHASLDRMTVINAVVAMVTQANGAPLEVDLDEPELNVFVDITARVCCLSLLPDFQKYSRYSIHALLGLGTHATGPRTQNVVTAVPDAPDNGDAETEPEASEQ